MAGRVRRGRGGSEGTKGAEGGDDGDEGKVRRGRRGGGWERKDRGGDGAGVGGGGRGVVCGVVAEGRWRKREGLRWRERRNKNDGIFCCTSYML